jgi:hypothetical protein
MVLVPSLVHAAVLDIPGANSYLSGTGVITGWKCEAAGDLTVRFFRPDGSTVFFEEEQSDTIPLVYGSGRPDVSLSGACADADVGFVAIWNWERLEADGAYTAVVYDNGVEFARNTFTVTTLGIGEDDVSGMCTIADFPSPGETTLFEWSPNSQHLEAVSRESSDNLGECEEGLTVEPGEMCSFFFSDTSFGEIGGIFSVNAEGQGCVEVDIAEIPCFNTDQEFDTLLSGLGISGIEVTKNTDGSWTIDSFPTDL